MVNVTIKSRKDTLSNWQTSNPVLSDGEVAVVEIPATDSTPAICLIKIGDGKTNFNTLQYMQSPAADVYAWAKKATKPEYDYSEIKNLTTMIVAGNNVTATTKDNKVTIATTQNVAKIPGTLPDIGDIEALPVWNSDEGWKRIDADALKATANTIVKRNASGQIVAAAPTANNHAANKLYVDNAATAANIKWGGLGSSAGNVTPIGVAMSDFLSANRLAFAKPAGITIEVSTDGGATWTDANIPDSGKIGLVSGIDGYHPTIGLVYPKDYGTAGRNATANDRLRITLDAAGMGVYTKPKKMLINLSTAGAKNCKVLIERATIGAPTEFQTVIEAGVSGWSGWNDINLGGQQAFGGSSSQTAQTSFLRLTFFGEGTSSGTGFLQVFNIALFGDTYWNTPSNYAKSGHFYTWDYNQNVGFPKQVRTSSVPSSDSDLTNKKYVDQQTTKIGTQTNKSKLASIEYLGEADIPTTPEIGKEYAITDLISYSDLDSDLQKRLDTSNDIIPKTGTAQIEITPMATQDISWVPAASIDEGTQVATIKVNKTSDGKLQVNISGTYFTSLDNGINEDFIIGTIPVVAGKTYTLPTIDTTALDVDDNMGGYKWTTANPFVATTTGTQNLIMHVYYAAHDGAKEVAGMKPIASTVSNTLSDKGLLQKTDEGYVFVEARNGISIGDGAVSVDEHVPYLPTLEATGIRTAIREEGQWKAAAISTTADNYSIARRGAGGTLVVAAPTSDNHAATKKYVDTAVAGAGGGSSKQLLRFDGNTTAYFDNVATSAYQYTFHLRGATAMNPGNVKITVGETTLFSLTPESSNDIHVDGILMCYPASSSSSNTQHYITYSYTASDGTCKCGYTGPSTDMRVTFNGTIGAPAGGIYTNWVIQEQMSCTNWVGQSSDEAIDDTETI